MLTLTSNKQGANAHLQVTPTEVRKRTPKELLSSRRVLRAQGLTCTDVRSPAVKAWCNLLIISLVDS